MNKKIKPTLGRLLFALALGALMGSSVTTIDYLINLYQVNGSEHFNEWAVSKGVRILIPSYIIWLISLFVFGVPVWLFLHWKEKTHWVYAIASGFFIPFTIILAMGTGFFTGKISGNLSYYGNGGQQWLDGSITPFGWEIAFRSAIYYALIGVCISAMIWLVCYRNVNKKP
ncbi:MAG: hypothetical protein L3J05_04805 [Robiginitomaculum sp.]|nr:hypothetical protein [Robiginitomaculum sp.]